MEGKDPLLAVASMVEKGRQRRDGESPSRFLSAALAHLRIVRNFAWVGLYQAPLRMIARVVPRCGVWAETQRVHCNWRPESHKPQLQWSKFSIIDYIH